MNSNEVSKSAHVACGSYITQLGVNAKNASAEVSMLTSAQKNAALRLIAERITANAELIKCENAKDIEIGKANQMSSALLDRLTLTDARIAAMTNGVLQICNLADPVGQVLGGGALANGLSVVKQRVPLGVIGIIFESRPNVTVDAAALCLKSGNVCILRGGSDAINSNKALTSIMRACLKECGICEDAVALVEDTSREVANEMMKLRQYIDVLVPRGGKGLISAVVANSTIPVIETGEGNCHIYVDSSANVAKAVAIIDNAKTQRPSVCNAVETLLVHADIADKLYSALAEEWGGRVQVYGDDTAGKYMELSGIATDEEYAKEFLDYAVAVRTVDGIDTAIAHINKFGTKHSECIITESIANANAFQRGVDAAAVYVNVSTRFTDGCEFGLGAEIGITTQKLHARGPMGLAELTTYKYLVNGDYLVRE